MTTITVGISELKKNFGNYIRCLKSGETIVITRHGRAIAKIVPITDSTDSKLRSVVEAGLADWNGRKVNPGAPTVANHSNTQTAGLVSGDRDFSGEL